MDATRGTNAYGFKLITVMVADEFGQGDDTCISKVVDIRIHVCTCIHASVIWITNRLSCCLVHSRPGEYFCSFKR